MMVKNKLEDLTLVVPTYFRQPYALRLMRYWNSKGPKVIVVDGTDKPIPKCELDGLGNSILYVHNPVGIYERLRGVLDLITTKYVALAGDDEFYIPSALASCIGELNDDSELVACSGIAIGFCPEQSFVAGKVYSPGLVGYAVLGATARDRVLFHMSNYEVNQIYGVCRSPEWKTIWYGITEREFPVFAIGEYQFELYMSFAGKSKVVRELMWLRNLGETKPIRGTDPSLGTLLFIKWYKDIKFFQERLNFLDISANTLRKLSNDYDYVSCRAIAEVGFDAFHQWAVAHRTREERLLSLTPVRWLRQLMPVSLRGVFKNFLNRRNQNRDNDKKLVEMVNLSNFAEKIARDWRIKVSFTELLEIEAAISQSKTATNSQS